MDVWRSVSSCVMDPAFGLKSPWRYQEVPLQTGALRCPDTS